MTVRGGPTGSRCSTPLRGLAAISVLLVHTAIFSGAFDDRYYGRFLAHLDIGVPFFFLLSAFLLYRPVRRGARARAPRAPGSATTASGGSSASSPPTGLSSRVAAIVPGMAGAFSGNWWVYYGLLQNYPVYEADRHLRRRPLPLRDPDRLDAFRSRCSST